MSRREKVKAWAVLREGDGEVRAIEPTFHDAHQYGRNYAGAGDFRVVRLVEYNPKADRVLKAALGVVKAESGAIKARCPCDQWGPYLRAKIVLQKAVRAYDFSTRKK